MTTISVITAVYNRKETIAQSIESVLAQNYTQLEYIVIDGGSRDGTLDVLEQYRGHIDVFVSEPDSGVYDALNKGIGLATGDVVGFVHADDLLADNSVLSKIARIFDDPSVDAIYGDLVYVRYNDISRVVRYWRSGAFSRNSLHLGWMPPHPTFYVRRKVYEQLGSFDLRYRISADYDSILRFLKGGNLRVEYIPQVLVRMRVGGVSNRSLRNIILKSREDLSVVRSNRIGGIGTVVLKNLVKVQQFWRR